MADDEELPEGVPAAIQWIPTGCWADRRSKLYPYDWKQFGCGYPAVNTVGLCAKHYEEIVGVPVPV